MSTVVEDLVAKLRLKPDERSWARGDKLIRGIKTAVAGFLGWKVTQQITHAINETVEYGSALNDTAQKTGLSVEALQRLGYVAKLNGSSMEEVAGATKFLGKALVEAKGGSKEAIAAFKQLKISVNDKAFKKLSLEQQLELVAKRMSDIPDGAKKSTLAMKLLGRSGVELIPTINDLGKNGAALRAEFEELGGGLSKDQTVALDEFGDSIDKTKATLGALKNQAIAALIPTLQEALEGFRAWVKENRELIKAGVTRAVQGVIAVFKVLGKVVAAIFEFIDEHHDQIAAVFQTIVDIVKVAIKIIKGIVNVFVALIKAVIAVGRAIINAFRTGWEFVKSVGERIKKFFVEDIPNAVRDAFTAMWDFIAHLPIIEQIRNTIADLKALKNFKGPAESTEYDQSYGARQTTESREDFNRRLENNIRLRQEEARKLIEQSEPARSEGAGGGAGSGSSGPVSVKGGDVNININGAQDPLAVNKLVREAVDDQMNSWLLQTREAVG